MFLLVLCFIIFADSQKAARIECDPCLAEIRNLTSYMNKIKSQLAAADNSPNRKDKFKSVMSRFFEEKSDQV